MAQRADHLADILADLAFDLPGFARAHVGRDDLAGELHGVGDVAGERLDVGHRILTAKSDRDALLIRGSGWRGGDGRGRSLDREGGRRFLGGRPGGRDRRDRRLGGLGRRPGALRRLGRGDLGDRRGARRCRRCSGGRGRGFRRSGPLARALDGAGGRLGGRALPCPGEHGLHRRGRRDCRRFERFGRARPGRRVHPCVERARIRSAAPRLPRLRRRGRGRRGADPFRPGGRFGWVRAGLRRDSALAAARGVPPVDLSGLPWIFLPSPETPSAFASTGAAFACECEDFARFVAMKERSLMIYGEDPVPFSS